ncbi:MAG TPA: PIG-L family deacetylase [Anaerolineaceae bacterium]|nr:PIG-L family deacetylase [Anaerolineaceae bacterium]HPN50399.1 PIG-L family deacetylase [Anaerolineaceae bacterium]
MKPLKPVELSSGQPPVLLAVLAHPDDETFGTGGTLALYARKGTAVHLACATRGEVGEVNPELMTGFKSVADLRESELRCAAGKLGLSGVYFLGYRDSGMPGSPDNTHPQALAAAPLAQVAAKVAHLIRKLKPQVVLTFDPIGGYRHPDHIAIHQATVRAFDLAKDPGFADPDGLPPFAAQKLYFHTIGRTFLRAAVFVSRLFGRDPRRFGKNGDIDLVSIAEVHFPTHAAINFAPVMQVRDDAAACHHSQGGKEMNKGIQGFISRLFGQYETFMRAYPAVQPGEPRENDLFARVK